VTVLAKQDRPNQTQNYLYAVASNCGSKYQRSHWWKMLTLKKCISVIFSHGSQTRRNWEIEMNSLLGNNGRSLIFIKAIQMFGSIADIH
jgi:hypothetical protein